jgi:class 3 adenylate cyclase/pimeloyl-ACP methyl ester carboxylesterase
MAAMEPQFRFCTSADGTRIAYATHGSGPTLVYANTPILSIDAQFRVPEARAYFDALAARTQLVMFDRRGTGASQRDVDDLSAGTEAGDLAAVVDATGVRDFTLFADIATHVCVTYALGDANRSRKLVLWSPLIESLPGEEMAEAARRDWSYFRRLWASRLFPDGPVALQRAMGKAYKDTATQEMAARRMLWQKPDFDSLLPRLTEPVLVIHRETSPHRQVMQFAALLQHGELRFVPGHPPTPYPDHEAIVQAVFDFMGLNDGAAVFPSGTAVILFTDIADSAALTERMGDAAFRARSREIEVGVKTAIREHGGRHVEGKVLGDGVMGVFTSAAGAIEAARQCARLGDVLPMHVGLHAGDVIRDEANIYGGAVNIASRICGLCEPGDILVSQTVRDLARTSTGVTFEKRGEHLLKGITDPVRVFAVRAQE